MRNAIALALLLAGCGSSDGRSCGSGYNIAESSKAGCRRSDEPGCQKCCRQEASGGCTEISSQAGTALYNVFAAVGSCPAGCPPCAQCLALDEDELCKLLATGMKCDCANIQIGIDPCFEVPMNCECYCQRYGSLSQRCPSR